MLDRTYTLYKIKQAAADFGIPYRFALYKRKVFLESYLKLSMADFWAEEDAVGIHYALDDARWCEVEIRRVEKAMADLDRTDEVTEEMIERARKHPIELILEFTRGKCRCINPEHPDNHPSMFHGTKHNIAVCPGCDYKVDPLAAYQHIYSVDFRTAVKSLQ